MSARPNSRLNFAGYIGWMRESLFNTRLNTVLTVVMTVVLVVFAFFVVRYVLFDANWGVVSDNLRRLFIGVYPEGSEWRIWIPFALSMALLGIIFGIWGSARTYTTAIVSMAVLLLVLGFSFIPSWLNALSFGLAVPFETITIDAETGVETQGISGSWLITALILASSYAISWLPRVKVARGKSLRSYSLNPIVMQLIGLAVILVIIVTILLQQGIFPSQWGGIFLDILVFSVGGCIIMFPLGLLLALSRNSQYPVLSYATTAYIEFIRAGPLVVWLAFAFFLWDDFVSFTPDFPIRAMLVFGFFGAAYIAEVVRGGLQSIPKGQYEAAFSVNLNTFQTYTIIILPQAVRAVVPAIIGRFIAIWKDTSLLVGLGGTINLLGAGRSILSSDNSNREFLIEIYLVIALLYWVISFVLSRFGKYTEKKLNL